MSEYLIGAGAILTAGPNSSIAGATLHAQTDPRLATRVEASVIDFESATASEISRVVIVATGWNRPRFEAEVVRSLLARGNCSLAEVIGTLGRATGATEVHLFARWSPEARLLRDLAAGGVRLIAHPLETLDQAALVSGQRLTRWQPQFRAA